MLFFEFSAIFFSSNAAPLLKKAKMADKIPAGDLKAMNKTNYNSLFEEEIARIDRLPERSRLLMHVCCAPCASAALERTVPFFETTAFFYNPNIAPPEELELRAAQLPKLIEAMDGRAGLIIAEPENDPFFSLPEELASAPEGGERCRLCFNLRLEKAALFAAENGYDYFCTSLTVGPMKNAELINSVGLALGEKYGVKWLCADFKKKGGYARSIELSRSYGLYRQNYCGCIYSVR